MYAFISNKYMEKTYLLHPSWAIAWGELMLIESGNDTFGMEMSYLSLPNCYVCAPTFDREKSTAWRVL